MSCPWHGAFFHGNWDIAMCAKICPVCEKPISDGQTYCSLACETIAARVRRSMEQHGIDKRSVAPSEGKIQVVKKEQPETSPPSFCQQCGKALTSSQKGQRYCSCLCAGAARRKVKPPKREYTRPVMEEIDWVPTEKNKKRPCHDCGKPTYNYRCSECWAKLRKKFDIQI